MRFRALIMASGLALAALGTTSARADVVITVDKSTQLMTVEVDGQTRWQWKVSTGRAGHDTPNGSFRAVSMDADHYSKKYDDAPMPHSIFFTNLGHAIHGSSAVSRLGTPASHGCVRLEPQNATKLFDLIAHESMRKATIVITGNAADAVARSHAPTTTATATATVTSRPTRQRTTDEHATAVRLYPQQGAQTAIQQASLPPAGTQLVPPPNYPPFPRAATF
jgi:hypothetical protein